MLKLYNVGEYIDDNTSTLLSLVKVVHRSNNTGSNTLAILTCQRNHLWHSSQWLLSLAWWQWYLLLSLWFCKWNQNNWQRECCYSTRIYGCGIKWFSKWWWVDESSLHISVVVTVDETDSTASWCPVVAANKQMCASMSEMLIATGLTWLMEESFSLLYSPFLRHVFIDLNSFTF